MRRKLEDASPFAGRSENGFFLFDSFRLGFLKRTGEACLTRLRKGPSARPEEEARDALLDRSGKLAIGGHTHLVMDRMLGNWRVINPGSVGLSFRDVTKAEWALITFENGAANVDLRTVPYDFQAVLADMAAVNYPHPAWLQKFAK